LREERDDKWARAVREREGNPAYRFRKPGWAVGSILDWAE
jgi:hypothetical protein